MREREAAAEEPVLTLAEVERRVWLAAPGVVVMRECPNVSAVTTDQLFTRARHLLEDTPHRKLIADLSEAGLPDAATRACIRNHLDGLMLEHFGVVVGENRLLKIAAGFVIANIRLGCTTQTYGSVDEALNELSEG